MKRLYRIDIPEQTQTRTSSDLQRRLATQGTLSGGQGVVESIGVDPGQVVLEGQFRGQYAALMATEVEELFSSDIDAVAYYTLSGSSPQDGYYAPENIGTGPLDPREDRLQRFDGRLRFIGTRASHYRELASAPTEVDHPWGNTLECLVGVPSPASEVQWVDPVTDESTPAGSPAATHSGEIGDVEAYDVAPGSPPYEDASLVYTLPYSDEGLMDCKVWDDHDRGKFDADGDCTWERAFVTTHEPAGSLVLDNGLLRVTLDTTGLQVEEYTAGAWTSVSLPASDWGLTSVDVRSITPVRVSARLVFTNTADGSTYVLDAVLHRGRPSVQFDRPSSVTTAVPQGLVDRLDPIADAALYDSGAGLGLRDRAEVQA